MIPVRSGVRVWLAVGRTDMRRGMIAWLCRYSKRYSEIRMRAIFMSSAAPKVI
jgi:hypothetical protein